VWRQIAAAIDNNPAIPRTHALGVLQSMYAAAQVIAVRRIAKGGPKDIAFDTLLRDIRPHASEITKDWRLPHSADEWGRAARLDWFG
jgi:hypothetical protein